MFYDQVDKARRISDIDGLIQSDVTQRQKLGAITLAADLKADGVEVDMGGLGNRPTFEKSVIE